MRASCRLIRLAALAAILLGLPAVAALARPPVAAAAETVANAAGRYDGLVLRDLGGKQAALVQLVAEDGAFTQRELWRSKKGAFDTRKATFVAGDVNGDGIADGIVLYDLGQARSRLLVYLSDGLRARQTTPGRRRPRAFAKARAKLAVGDLNRDGRDDVIVLYDRGPGRAALYRFTSLPARSSARRPAGRRVVAPSRARGRSWRPATSPATGATTPSCSTGPRPPHLASTSSSPAPRSSLARRSGAASTPPAAPGSPPATPTATATSTPSVCTASPTTTAVSTCSSRPRSRSPRRPSGANDGAAGALPFLVLPLRRRRRDRRRPRRRRSSRRPTGEHELQLHDLRLERLRLRARRSGGTAPGLPDHASRRGAVARDRRLRQGRGARRRLDAVPCAASRPTARSPSPARRRSSAACRPATSCSPAPRRPSPAGCAAR